MGASIGSLDRGLFIYEDTSISLAEKKYIRYEKKDKSIYMDKFNDLIGEGIFQDKCLFEDHIWVAYGRNNYMIFDFTEIEYNQKLYNALKFFVILQLYDRRLVVNSVIQGLKYILKMIRMTNGYDKQFLKEFIEYVEQQDLTTKRALSHFKNPNLSFLYFNPINDSKDYVEILLTISDTKGSKGVREIPTYSNFILFDQIIHDFMSNTTSYLREKYYPVFIWWKLTSVIPIRPIEFIEILNEGIRYEEKEDAYYILIPRRKQQPDPINEYNRVAIQHELKMGKEMYDIICDYRKVANIEHEKYLFPLSVYTRFLKNEKISFMLLHYTEHMGYAQMTLLLDGFFDEIIDSQYYIKVVQNRDELDIVNEHKSIKRFNLGDTRHMSICLMMMQGFSELTIAQMAGHTNIKTQAHYSSHIDDFQRSYSGLLEKDILQKMNIGDKSGFNSFTFRQRQLLSYAFEDNSKARKVDYGFCHSNNFPFECFVKDCIFCNKFQIDLSSLSAKELNNLKNKITKIQDEIQVKLNFIKKYYSTAFKSQGSLVNKIEKDRKELERNANNLEILMNREAMVKAHIKKIQEV
ncbi:hypothetical protein RGU12_10515 [Fredinandcohnia sp. QZ13]|uniref:hypothetical protein n=1 Tax=Fredinandcohnia sp. QZ13 TaxID=3073144 RepID=UPI0028533D3C|nr:hypothetical protein [Fredinandcohnia sp. QZ13]MDR4887981.1 hypothetical protein [Fredinandcohnia sp. QZ13]